MHKYIHVFMLHTHTHTHTHRRRDRGSASGSEDKRACSKVRQAPRLFFFSCLAPQRPNIRYRQSGTTYVSLRQHTSASVSIRQHPDFSLSAAWHSNGHIFATGNHARALVKQAVVITSSNTGARYMSRFKISRRERERGTVTQTFFCSLFLLAAFLRAGGGVGIRTRRRGYGIDGRGGVWRRCRCKPRLSSSLETHTLSLETNTLSLETLSLLSLSLWCLATLR